MSDLFEGKIVDFKIDKQLIYVKQLGKGGTGEVHLFREELTDKKYAIKKFNPIPENDGEDSFKRFVDEIRMLVDLNHKNIVRMYTYYLYPTIRSGYLQMEYVEGDTIDRYLDNNPQLFDAIFRMAIDAFLYMEQKGVLHRDIRPSNFLISNDELKIIDFGFGKKLDQRNINENSVFLLYPFSTMPEEISSHEWAYDEVTEIYFLGCLFRKIGEDKKTNYGAIIAKMCEITREKRFQSFSDIKQSMQNNVTFAEFSEEQKNAYRSFADSLMPIISKFTKKPEFKDSSEEILQSLLRVCSKNALENKVQNNQDLLNCFLSKGEYFYSNSPKLTVSSLVAFCNLLRNSDSLQRELITDGIKNRLSAIKIEDPDDLPF